MGVASSVIRGRGEERKREGGAKEEEEDDQKNAGEEAAEQTAAAVAGELALALNLAQAAINLPQLALVFVFCVGSWKWQ